MSKLTENISVKAMCLITHNGRFLVNKGYDKVKKQTFHRLIGGKVELGERSIDTIRREIHEELDCGIKDIKFMSTQEEIFTYNGERGHEVIFLYTGNLSDEGIKRKEIITNPDSHGFPAVWISAEDVLDEKVILYPSFDYKRILSEL